MLRFNQNAGYTGPVNIDASSIQADGDVNLYVNNITGSDTPPGNGTLARPYRTVMKALSMLPASWQKAAFIRLAASPTPYSFETNAAVTFGFSFLRQGAPQGVQSEQQALAFIGGYQSAFGTRTVTAANTAGTTVAFNGAALGAGAADGATVRWLTSANGNAGNSGIDSRTNVRSSGGNSLKLLLPLANPIAFGDTFVIERPSVTINYGNPGAGGFFDFYNSNLVGFSGIKLQAAGAFARTIKFGGTLAYLQGCEIDLGGGSIDWNHFGNFHAGSFQFNFWLIPEMFSYNAGVYIHDGAIINSEHAESFGFWVMRDLYVQCSLGSEMFLAMVDAKNCDFDVFDHGYIEIDGSYDLDGAPYPSTLDGGGGVSISGLSNCFMDVVDISNGYQDAIKVSKKSNAVLGLVTGTLNSGAGILAKLGSSVQTNFFFGGGNTTVTGTAGNTVLGTQTIPNVQTYAAINAPDGNGVAGISDTYGNRIEVDVP